MVDNVVEQIFADVAGLTPEKHKNVLGDKRKYINAINERLADKILQVVTFDNIRPKLDMDYTDDALRAVLIRVRKLIRQTLE